MQFIKIPESKLHEKLQALADRIDHKLSLTEKETLDAIREAVDALISTH